MVAEAWSHHARAACSSRLRDIAEISADGRQNSVVQPSANGLNAIVIERVSRVAI